MAEKEEPECEEKPVKKNVKAAVIAALLKKKKEKRDGK